MTTQRINANVSRVNPYQPPTLPGIKIKAMLAANENPLGPGLLAQEAMKNHMPQAGFYPNAEPLFRSLSLFHALSKDHFLVGNGSNEVLDIIARTFITPGDGVVLSQYAFVAFGTVSKLSGAKITQVKAHDFGHDIEKLVAAVSAETRILWLANPNNPTGTYIPHSSLLHSLKKVPRSCLIVLDEAYIDYLEPELHEMSVNWLDKLPNLIIVRTFSKIHGLASLRVGYAIAHKQIISLMNNVRQPFNSNGMAIAAAAASLWDSQHVAETRLQNNRSMRLLCMACDEAGLPYTRSHANFLMVDIASSQTYLNYCFRRE